MDQFLSVEFIVSILAKLGFILFALLAFIMLRQSSLMAKVVNVPVNGSFRFLVLVYLLIVLLLTAIVIVV